MLNSQIHLDFDNVNSLSSSTTGVIIPSTGKDNWDAVIASSQNGKNNHFALSIEIISLKILFTKKYSANVCENDWRRNTEGCDEICERCARVTNRLQNKNMNPIEQ